MTRRYNLKVSDFARAVARAADAAEGKRLGHSRCISHLAYLLAAEEGLSAEDGQALLIAGLFHDLGWVLLASELGRLAASEPEFLPSHPLGGRHASPELDLLIGEHGLLVADLLRPLGLPPLVGEIIAMGHESWDGTGLPDGLSGSQIPDTALMLAVADHAVTLLDDVVRDGTGSVGGGQGAAPIESVRELSRYAGTHLDPELVEVAVDLLGADDGWQRVIDGGRYEPLIDEAFYPLFGDFLELGSPEMALWTDLIGDLADRFHPLVPQHARKVGDLSVAIAREMGLSEEEALELEVAAKLAEIGRVGLPAPLVFRIGAFTEAERELLKSYPTIGERILEPIRAARPIFEGAISHREKLNGTGYPQGLAGDQIPLPGRILAVADTFVALTQFNPQRPGYSHAIALRILQGEETKLFDGLVVDALEAAVKGGEAFPPP